MEDIKNKLLTELVELFNKKLKFEEALKQVIILIQNYILFPENTILKIVLNTTSIPDSENESFNYSDRFNLNIPGENTVFIELYYFDITDNEHKEAQKYDKSLLSVISEILAGYISKEFYKKLLYDNRERLKELKGINQTRAVLHSTETLEEALQNICNHLPAAWQYPEYTAARIIYEDKIYTTSNFKETQWSQKQVFDTPDGKKGVIEVYYLKKFPDIYEGPFLKEERDLINNLANIISGSVTKKNLQQLLYNNTERLKELKGINQTSKILKQGKPLEEALQEICDLLPEAWQYPEYTAARIIYEDKEFKTANFKKTQWVQRQKFETPAKGKGVIEVYYLKEFPEIDEGPFMKEERNLINNLAEIISGSAAKNILSKLIYDNNERLKELKGINQTAKIIAQGKSIEETLQKIVNIIPKSWQYPDYTVARIIFEGKIYKSPRFKETKWFQRENFITIDNKKGSIEVFYLKQFPYSYEGPFLSEERDLLYNISKLITGYINDIKGRELINSSLLTKPERITPEEYKLTLIKNKQPVQEYFNRQIIDKYIYLEMMRFKVKEILFVSTLYDAFTLESEEGFFEEFMGLVYQYSLFSLPRITGASTQEDAIDLVNSTRFDLVVIMVGLDQTEPLEISKKIKTKYPDLPIYVILNNKINAKYFEDLVPNTTAIDKLFYWFGDSQIFFTLVKLTEDKVNADNDIKVGLVRIILLIEDSPMYYSKFLPILYSAVFGQVQKLLVDAGNNELEKLSRMRSRPKIMLATNYEEAIYIFNKYKDHLLCVISDIEFEKEGIMDKKAGLKFIKYARSYRKDLPVLLQSSEIKYAKKAFELNTVFIDKNSENLANDLKSFLSFYLGFGDFVFRDKDGKKIAVAHTFREFEQLLQTVPSESILFHALNNQFSIWLMARGEIKLAKEINPLSLTDFKDVEQMRNDFIEKIKKYREERKRGRVVNFDEYTDISEKNIIALASGSLGGKGRGLAFINMLIYNVDFSGLNNQINICTPKTFVIGTDEYEDFVIKNKIFEKILKKDYNTIKQIFVKSKLSGQLKNKLKAILINLNGPLAVRSSSLSEDSLTQPFAGIFETYIIPNNKPSLEERFNDLIKVIKLIYASVFSQRARKYFEAINHKVEDEKMAVIIQELVGKQYNGYFYPHISGIAQSYNYYPLSHMKPEEGFAIAAVGLGVYVVDGGNAYRFSPKYPKTESYTIKNLLNSTQLKFYALDLNNKDIDFLSEGENAALVSLDISEAEKHGTLTHCASVYDIDNDRLIPGLSAYGPRVINFANILKYDYLPLAQTIDIILETIKKAMGSPVEIEYAVDLSKNDKGLPSFYLLQIKPLIGDQFNYQIKPDKISKTNTVLFTKTSMGNGKIDNISDIVYVDTDFFNKLETKEIAHEIEEINEKLIKQNIQYILIGPGRWGTSERFLGIPVNWSQISNARIIVEMSLDNFPLDASLGSHFFHNITTANVGYFAINSINSEEFINWKLIKEQKLI